MRTHSLDKNKPLLFLGDNHGDWTNLFCLLDHNKILSSTIIHLGDDGVGFHGNPATEHSLCEELNKEFKKRDIAFFSLRGNHCDPKYFAEPHRIALSHFELLEDYSLGTWGNKTLQFIGGAISVDRKGRIPFKSHWPNEGLQYLPERCKKVDILVTHSCPSWCYPQRFGPLVEDWARIDPSLKKDLTQERKALDKLFEICQPEFHYYGHMHQSWNQEISGCRHRLLDINELYEHRPPDPHVSLKKEKTPAPSSP
jgi:hypothetical protein